MTERTPVAEDLGALAMLAPRLAETFVSVATDIALVIDQRGVICNVAVGTEPIAANPMGWVGKPWVDTVTADTRQKIESLLQEARAGGVTRRREVNHPVDDGAQVPVAYAAVRLGRDGPVLAVGRDLRAVSAIQQRFMDAQQSMEREHWRQRHAEARYRTLFQAASDGVLVVDADTLCIVEANHAAAELFHRDRTSLVGRPLSEGVIESLRPMVNDLLTRARTSGRPCEVRALLEGAPGAVAAAPAIDLSATPFRAEEALLLLVRVRIADSLLDEASGGHRVPDFVQRTPDAIAIADCTGRVLIGNPAFTQLCRDAGGLPAAAGDPVGRALASLLGDATGRLGTALAAVRQHGIIDQHPLAVGVDAAHQVEVEVSAALLAEGDQACIGLTLRRVDLRLAAVHPQVGALASALDRLAAQVGIVTLPELLHEATDLAERHLIDSALARSQGDRMQAAQLLGVTAENLWLRMRHHGMARSAPEGASSPNLLN